MVPNSQSIIANVDNMGEDRSRRLSTQLEIAYDTPSDRIEAFCEGIRQPRCTRTDAYHASLNRSGDPLLELPIHVFRETPDWSTEARLTPVRFAWGSGPPPGGGR